MKNFLFDKFNNFTEAFEKDSFVSFTKNLPGTLHLDPAIVTIEGFPIWGYESGGFWSLNRVEARFYENDGTIHCIGKRYNEDYCSNHRLVTSNLANVRSLVLMETDRFEITNSDHISCKEGDSVYYAKFVAPAGELGWPITSALLANRVEYGTEFYKNLTDVSCEVYKSFKAAGVLCPAQFSPKVFFCDSKGMYLGIISDFTVSFSESVDNVINASMRDTGQYDKDEVLSYGVPRWQALKI